MLFLCNCVLKSTVEFKVFSFGWMIPLRALHSYAFSKSQSRSLPLLLWVQTSYYVGRFPCPKLWMMRNLYLNIMMNVCSTGSNFVDPLSVKERRRINIRITSSKCYWKSFHIISKGSTEYTSVPNRLQLHLFSIMSFGKLASPGILQTTR